MQKGENKQIKKFNAAGGTGDGAAALGVSFMVFTTENAEARVRGARKAARMKPFGQFADMQPSSICQDYI